MRSILYLIASALVMLSGFQSVTAQESSCVLPSVSLPLFDATPAVDVPGAQATPASPDDAARDATADEVAEFEAALDVLVTCMSSGNAGYIYAVFTERYLASWFVNPDGLYQPDLERIIDQNYGIDDAAAPIDVSSVSDVKVRDDGRMSGRVIFTSAGMSWTDILVLQQTGEYWLIDDVIRISR